MAAKIFWLISLFSLLLMYQTIYGQPTLKGGDTAMGTGLWLLFLLAVFGTALIGLTIALTSHGGFNWITTDNFIRWLAVVFGLLLVTGAISAAVLTQTNVDSLAKNGGWLSLTFRIMPLLILTACGLQLWSTNTFILIIARGLSIAGVALSLLILLLVWLGANK
jgi:hypothetical protein